MPQPRRRRIERRALLAGIAAMLPGAVAFGEARPAVPASAAAGKSRIDVRDFGTPEHPFRGGGDDAVAIQAAIDYAASIGGGAVYLGPGPISFTGSRGRGRPALAWTAPGIVLQGDGPGGTVITVKYDPAGDVIAIGSAAGNRNATQSGMRDLGIGLAAGRHQAAGAAIHSENGQKHQFQNIHSFGGFDTHFRVGGGPDQYVVWIARCLIDAASGTRHAIAIGDDGNAPPQDTMILDLESGGNRAGRECIAIYNAGGVTIANADIINYAAHALLIAPGPGQRVVNAFIDNLQCDTCGGDGALLAPAAPTGRIENMRFSLSWFSSNGGAGIHINGSAENPTDGVHLSNCTAGGNAHHGVWIDAHCRNVDLDNITAAGNSAAIDSYTGKPTGTVATYSGVMVDSGGNLGVSIVGGRSGTAGAWDGAGATQRFGYAFGPDTDFCALIGASASGPEGLVRNAKAGLLDASRGRHNRIERPVG